MENNFRDAFIDGLYDRLARYARKGTPSQRLYIVEELTHALSCEQGVFRGE